MTAQGIRQRTLSRSRLRQPVGQWYPAIVQPFDLKPQEIPFEHPDSCNMFEPGPDKPLVATAAAIAVHSHETIVACWQTLRQLADEHQGIDYLQVFETRDSTENLWFIEDGPGGAITAMLPSDY